MSLHLDARQRAMLQEMGVTVWGPSPAQEATAQPPASAPSAPAAVAAPTVAPPRAQPHAPSPAPAERPPAPLAHTTSRSTSPAPAPATTGPAAPALRLHPPQALYPTADPAQTPAGLGRGWLIVAESMTPAEPLGGDAGRLLDNMLRAMQLHRHPRVFLAALERSAPGTEASADIPATLADAVAQLQPAMVLVLGHVAARAALGRTEPLGRLRAGPHVLAGCPAVVTYDPAFLLRSQDNKAAAWADLCRALAMVRSAEAEG
ncbi:uracil-DNA glycosylase family protein [Acidovorax sp. Root568]|uniref:uracil-DNA glycosylase family protein n=1 Tax=Acidovorax sp. Root568 TaxID=1736565 RepID=UPI0007018165|nr:uracil-DNA glycosylase family protein [Acidovorax sp. Root568]KRA18852.1 DNA polymerase [Acidovorax sp. Root568]